MNKENNRNETCMVIFQPSGRRGYVEKGKTIKEASEALGVDIEGVCGNKGTCGKCKVRVEEGVFEKYGIQSGQAHLSTMASTEVNFFSLKQKNAGYRLACQANIFGDIVIFVPEESRMGKQVVRKSFEEIVIELNPAIKKYYVEMPQATLQDVTGDWDRLMKELERSHGLKNLTIDYQTLIDLQEIVREDNWKVTVSVWYDREVIKVEAGKNMAAHGLAVDVGTTTVAGYLSDMNSGKLVAVASMMNPQVVYGEDVVSRISYIMTHPEGLAQMNKAIVDGINSIVKEVSANAGIKQTDVLDMTIVGNTCMHHLYLNIDPKNIGKPPFAPALNCSVDVKARDWGLRIPPEAESVEVDMGSLCRTTYPDRIQTEQEFKKTSQIRSAGIKIAPGSYVHALPVEAGFVGADNVGVLIAETPYSYDSIVLIIDIGTNGELVLGNRQKLLSASCATGPALEGAEIRFGMRAAPGAIEKIIVDKETKDVYFKVIGRDGWNKDLQEIGAKGICGSGIIDVVPQLFLAGVIDMTGRFRKDIETPRYRQINGRSEFVIAWARETSIGQDIVVCQKDIRAIQLAKGAMYAGARILMRTLGVEKVDKVVLAGAFGSCINKESAALLGLFPDCEPENICSVGNAAGSGARMALLNVDKRREAEEIARWVEYLELAIEPDFDKYFSKAMWIPHMEDEFPHLAHLFPEIKLNWT